MRKLDPTTSSTTGRVADPHAGREFFAPGVLQSDDRSNNCEARRSSSSCAVADRKTVPGICWDFVGEANVEPGSTAGHTGLSPARDAKFEESTCPTKSSTLSLQLSPLLGDEAQTGGPLGRRCFPRDVGPVQDHLRRSPSE